MAPLTGPARTTGSWLVAPHWDAFWMFSGLWLVAAVLLGALSGFANETAEAIFFPGFLLLWGGHILAPMVCVWGTAALRSQIRFHRLRLLAGPGALIVGSAVIGAVGIRTEVADSARRLAIESYHGVGWLLFYGFLAWNLWHFAAQHFGVLSLYRARQGRTDPRDRKWDRWFCNVLTLGLLPVAWYTQSARLGSMMDLLPDPTPRGPLAWTVITLAAGVTAAVLLRESRHGRVALPRMLYIASIGAQTVFGALAYHLYHFAVFTMAHWLVAIALAARIGNDAGGRRTARRPFLVQAALLVGLSAPMYLVFRSQAVPRWILGAVSAFAETGEGFRNPFFGLVAGLWIGISFTHFVYDQYLYSFRRPEIRSTVGPRLLSSP